jgi:hypothetical protein
MTYLDRLREKTEQSLERHCQNPPFGSFWQ